MKRYSKYIKPYWQYFLLAPSLMMIEVFCDVQIPALAAKIINEGVSNGDANRIYELMVQMALYVVLAIIGGVGASYCASKACVNFSCDLREELFDKIQTFSFRNIDNFSTGSLVTRLTNDVTQMEQLVMISLRMVIRAPGMLIGALIMSFLLNPDLAMIFLVMIPVLSVIIVVLIRMSFKRFGVLQEKVDGLNQTVREALVNVRVIKGLAREDHETEKFKQVNGDLKNTALSAYAITILQLPLMTLIINLCTVAVVYIGGQGVIAGTMEMGDITAFITYTTQILMAVAMLSFVFLQLSRATASSKRICEVLDLNVELSDTSAKHPNKQVETGKIVFQDVNFRYALNNKENVLGGINLEIESGQTVGIIGSTGSGKSSLVQLIPRLYDVNEGAVLVDGVDVRDYSMENLREGIAMVLQNNILFTGTIEDNLRWGDKSATPEQQVQVATWASAHEFIDRMPRQYQNYVQQGGANLSGGQKQRMCIARALLKNPKIIILDDSTSAVDTATERSIRECLANELSGVTTIIIAQRISSVMEADQIIVLNEGEVEGVGTHHALMETCKTYQEVYDSQVNKEVME